MKKLFTKTAFVLAAAAMTFTSCVKNEVSDEVKALRAGQVDKQTAETAKINAETANIAAQTAFENARTAGQLIANAGEEANNEYQAALYAHTEALNALQLELAAAQNANDLAEQANIATRMVQEQAIYMAMLANSLLSVQQQELYQQINLVQAQQALAQQQAAYAKYLAEGDFADDVVEYSNEYGWVMDNILNKYAERNGYISSIAYAELMLAQWSDYTHDELLAMYAADLVDLKAELTAANAALTSLKNALANPTTIKATVDAKTLEYNDLMDQYYALMVSYQEAQNIASDAYSSYSDVINAAYADGVVTSAEQTAINAAWDNYIAKSNAASAIWNQASAKSSDASQIYSVINALNSQLSNINSLISQKEYQIANLEYDIVLKENQIESGNIDKSDAETALELLNTRLSKVNQEIVDLEAQADYWRSLLDAAILAANN